MTQAHKDKNYLLEKVLSLLEKEKRGKLLDVGCGGGWLSKRAKDSGFDVVACDLNSRRFKFHSEIEFKKVDLNQILPFEDKRFDYVVFLEVIEHIENPQLALREFFRILNREGTLFLSTPNTLNLHSRMRFLTEGAYDFFREPPVELLKNYGGSDLDLHLTPFRYQELDYILHKNGFKIKKVTTDFFHRSAKAFCFLKPLLWLQMYLKRHRAKRKGNIDYSRIHKTLLSPELLYGRHLIIKAKKA